MADTAAKTAAVKFRPPSIGWKPTDTFAARLVLLRRELGLTIRQAAELCGQHYATWSTWERGSSPSWYAEVCDEISEKLGVDRDWLAFGGELHRAGTPNRRVQRWELRRAERAAKTAVEAAASAPETDVIRRYLQEPPATTGTSATVIPFPPPAERAAGFRQSRAAS